MYETSGPDRSAASRDFRRWQPAVAALGPRHPTGGNPMTIRLLLADDQHLVRAGLAALLNLEHDLEVVHQLPDGTEVVESVRDHAVDVAVLDIEMPEIDG